MNLIRFTLFGVRSLFRGGWIYYAWLAFLFLLVGVGVMGYAEQWKLGHIASNMRDQVSWGLFIGTYAFYVGVAAAAVALVIPGYVYQWKPIKKIVIIGEILAISSVVMCLLFVMADLGHPERFWHMLPWLGILNIPSSLMGWNVLILNSYLVLNLIIVGYLLYRMFIDRPYNKTLVMALMFLSIPLAIAIHSTTAFIFNVLPARPYWNSAILVPRFIATALCSGPALMIIIFQILRRFASFHVENRAIDKIAEVMAYAIGINLLLFLAEVVTDFASGTEHLIHMQYYFGGLTFYAISAPIFSITAFFIFLRPQWRTKPFLLNIGCILILVAVYVEKGIGLVVPGYTPTPTGEIYNYIPSRVEWMIWAGVSAVGMLIFTILTKMAISLIKAKEERGHSQEELEAIAPQITQEQYQDQSQSPIH